VQAYFARIEEVNIKGPGLRAVLELNPSALKQAALLDIERKRTGKRSELHGIPVLLKVSERSGSAASDFLTAAQDNIATIAAEGISQTDEWKALNRS
jgi:amidase